MTERVFKLVRDKIPDRVDEATRARHPQFHVIEKFTHEFSNELWLGKLQEELDELKEAVQSGDAAKVLEEALDLSMFLDEFKATRYGYPEYYNHAARTKFERNGGATGHTVMEWDEE